MYVTRPPPATLMNECVIWWRKLTMEDSFVARLYTGWVLVIHWRSGEVKGRKEGRSTSKRIG
jgi:hypothetical protein